MSRRLSLSAAFLPRWWWCWLVATMLAFPALGQETPSKDNTTKDPDTREPRDPLVEGVVLMPDGEPAAGVTVWLVGGPYEGDAQMLGQTTTGEDGAFRFSEALREAAFGSGVRRPSVLARDARHRLGWQTSVRDPDTRDLKIELVDVSDSKGRLIDAQGVPIVGAQIRPQFLKKESFREKQSFTYATLFSELIEEFTARSAEDGSFVVQNVPAGGSITATISATGFGSPRIMWDAAEPVTIRLAPAGGVRGKAVIEGGGDDDLSGLKFHIRLEDEPTEDDQFRRHYWTDLTPDASGSFRLDKLPPGKYTISPRFGSNSRFYADATEPFEVKPGQSVTGLSVGVHRGVPVQGRVVDAKTGKGVEDVSVWVYHIDDRNVMRYSTIATTDTEGRYTAHTRPGPVGMRVQRTPEAYLAPLYERQSPQVEATEPIEWPVIELGRAVEVHGIVVDESGAPVAGAEVQVVVPNRAGRMSVPPLRTDAEGKFTVKQMDPTDTLPLRARTESAATDGAIVVIPEELDAPVRLVVSPQTACRLRGRIVDESGHAVAGAEVAISWSRSFVSRKSQMAGLSSRLGRYASDASGRFETDALWPGDEYRVRISAEGYGDTESPKITGNTGETHDLGSITLQGSGGFVEGRVVDSAGRAVPEVTIFNVGESRERVSTRSDEDGKFRLEGLYTGPAYVFAEKHGFRFTAVRAETGRRDVTIRLTRHDEPPPGMPASDYPSLDEQKKLARRLLEKLWAHPSRNDDGDAHRILQIMARIDPAEALKWSETCAKPHDSIIRTTAAERVAETDVDEALALIAEAKEYHAYQALKRLAEKYVTSAPEKARRFAEEGIIQARAMEQPSRTWSLAQMGSLLAKAGQEAAGRKVLNEAAELSTEGHQGLARGIVAAAVAPFDLARSRTLLAPVDDPRALDRYRGMVAAAVAPHDLTAALGLVDEIERPYQRGQVKMRIAHALAETKPDEAVRVAEKIDEPKYKAEALGWVAVVVAPRDRRRASVVIDRALEVLMTEAEAFRSWGNYGGGATMAAWLAVQAQAAHYPDVGSLVLRTLSMRLAERYESQSRQLSGQVAMAMVLALVDPHTARQVLANIEPRREILKGSGTSIGDREWLKAWIIADPHHGIELIERRLAASRNNPDFDLNLSGILEAVELLTVPPDERAYPMLRFSGPFWFPGEE